MEITGITRTYRGRPGCGCGCRGTYSERPGTAKRRAAVVAEALAAGSPDARIDGDIIALETETTYTWLYFADEAAAQSFYLAARGIQG